MNERTFFSPTKEQQKILGAKGNRVRINARAGTGKTVTMQMLAEKLNTEGRKILYLVYNTRARKEAENKIPKNVAKVSTVHSFALGSVPGSEPLKSKKRNIKWANLKASDLLQDFALLGHKYQMVAALATDFLQYFLNSQYSTLKDAIDPFSSQLDQLQSVVFTRYADKIISVIKAHMKRWISGEEACPHDFYLKLAYKEGWLVSRLHDYSALLVDEAQDLSPIMMQAIEDFPGRLFAVGDSHQQIYSFRYAVDAMNLLDFDEEYELSLSFRFGNEIANLVSNFIRELKKEKLFRIRGNPKKKSNVQVSDNFSELTGRGTAVLARTNLGLVKAAVQLLHRNVRFTFGKDVRGILSDAENVYWLSRKRHDRIHKNRFLRSFESIGQLEEYAEAMNDRPLLQLIRITKKYGAQTPKLLDKLSKLSKTTNLDGVVLSTVHGVKGLEFPEVRLCDDMFETLSTVMKHNREKVNEEANIVYVAMTRAQSKLIMPEAARGLPLDWLSSKDTIRAASEKHQRHVGHLGAAHSASLSASKRPTTIRYLSGSTKRNVRRSSREAIETNNVDTYSVGDRVITANGPGRIIEKRGGRKYLIELDDYPCKMCLSSHMFSKA